MFKPQTRVVLPDLHIPFHDPRLLRKWLDFVEDLQPDGIDIIGDFLDCYKLSRFDTNPARRGNLQTEVDTGIGILSDLRSRVGKSCDIRFSEGNHEDRLRKLLWGNCRQLSGIRNLTVPDLLGLEKFRISYHRASSPYRVGSLWYTHGVRLSSTGGLTARLNGQRLGGSIIVGHSHRMGWIPESSYGGICDYWECGCLCKSQLEYTQLTPNWQQGWLVVDFLAPTRYTVTPAIVRNGTVLYQGASL